MNLEVAIEKEIEFPDRMSRNLAEMWADSIPIFSDNNPKIPEWNPSRVMYADLTKEGYGKIIIKDESDTSSNPTGTIKDRMAWEVATLYRDFARTLLFKTKNGLVKKGIETVRVPRVSIITAGNAGTSLAYRFKQHGLPPVKLLLDSRTPASRIEKLRKQYADIYLTDLSAKELLPEDITKATNNNGGLDITSTRAFRPEEVFYDWHVHEVFNLEPDMIFVPYGSARLYENYLRWQEKSIRDGIENKIDPRLGTSLDVVSNISILGAKPKRMIRSKADKLTTKYSPFTIFDDREIKDMSALMFTGEKTGVYTVNETNILRAYELFNRFCNAEYSGAAGLALYLELIDKGKINKRSKAVIVNTGRGI